MIRRGVCGSGGSARDASWVLIAPPFAMRVNGQPLALGIRVLRDKDEIIEREENAPLFFSTERLAAVEPFSGDAPVVCARCRNEIAPGADAWERGDVIQLQTTKVKPEGTTP